MLLPVSRAIPNVSSAGESKRVAEGVGALVLRRLNEGTRAPSLERCEVFVSGHGLAGSAAMAKAGVMHVVGLFESLFGNTREVAEAIADGARAADPTAEVACLRVAEADRKGQNRRPACRGGPTHIRGMTSGMSRMMGLTAEEKKDELSSTRSSQALRVGEFGTGSATCRRRRRALRPRPLTPAATPGWRVERHTGSPGGCATTGTTWLPSRRASSSRAPKGRCARVNPSGHGFGGPTWFSRPSADRSARAAAIRDPRTVVRRA